MVPAKLALLCVVMAAAAAAHGQDGAWTFEPKTVTSSCTATFAEDEAMIRLGVDASSGESWIVFGSTALLNEDERQPHDHKQHYYDGLSRIKIVIAHSDEPCRSKLSSSCSSQSFSQAQQMTARVGPFATKGRMRMVKFLNDQVASRFPKLNFIFEEGNFLGGVEVDSVPLLGDNFSTMPDRRDFRISVNNKVLFQGGWRDGATARDWLQRCQVPPAKPVTPGSKGGKGGEGSKGA